jgi:hypothetical protein
VRTILLGLYLITACKVDAPTPACQEACCVNPDTCPDGFTCDPVSHDCVLLGQVDDDAGVGDARNPLPIFDARNPSPFDAP